MKISILALWERILYFRIKLQKTFKKGNMNYNISLIYFLYYKLIPQVHVISKFADIIHIDTMIIARKFLIMIMMKSEKPLILKISVFSKISVILSYIIFNMVGMIYFAACRYMCNDSKILFQDIVNMSMSYITLCYYCFCENFHN